jgi:sec-independent protein translocase protein TatB
VFNVGPLELVVLALVAIVVFGPDRLPELARDAAQLIRGLREVAKGARTQLQDELGPEFADVDLRNLNPRVALRKALLGEELDLGGLDPRGVLREAFDEAPAASPTADPPSVPTANGAAPAPAAPAVAVPAPAVPPVATSFDDAT